MRETEALAAFAARDEAAAERAFADLHVCGVPFLRSYLRTWLREAQDAEDVIAETFLRIWRYRPRFADRGVAAWYRLLKQTADQCLIDLVRRRDLTVPLDDPRFDTVPAKDVPLVDSLMVPADELEHLYQWAHELWLGLDPAVPAYEHAQRLLAAQLFFLDGARWEEVARLLRPGDGSGAALSREELDEWLSDASVLRHLAYQTLHYDNDRLTAALLGIPPECPHAEALDGMMRRALAARPDDDPPSGWTWKEVAFVLWRFRHALLLEQIMARHDCQLDREQMDQVLDRSRALFPFKNEMSGLLTTLARGVSDPARDVLGAIGLWQRLAFQYCYHDDLPHRDIQERIDPAGQMVGAPVTLGMLNVWLSNGRLKGRLARYAAVRRQETRDE